jgi:hypothetical protein
MSESGEMVLSLAGPDDNADVLRLLRDNPMEGEQFKLALTRESDFSHASATTGDRHQTLLIRVDGKAALIGERSSQMVWLNGEQKRLGYYSQARVDPAFRGGKMLLQGFAFQRQLHDEDPLPLYLTTIVEGNQAAMRALTKERPGKPTYVPFSTLCTLAIPAPRIRKVEQPNGVILRRARKDQLEEIADCLQRNLQRYQFAPCWTAESLSNRCRDLKAEDFLVALRDGRIVGTMATWDQRNFKQTIVHDYAPTLGRLRPAVNLFAQYLPLPHLPPPGQELRHAYLSHIAVDDDDRKVFRALLAESLNNSVGRGYSYLTLGLDTRNPLLGVAKTSFFHFAYRSQLFLVHWAEDKAAAQAVDSRIPQLELAIL